VRTAGPRNTASSHALSAPAGVSSLLAIAVVRGLLLELEVAEDEDPQRLLGEPIEIWVVRPMAEFEGRTPAQVLAAPGGDVVLRSLLKRWLR